MCGVALDGGVAPPLCEAACRAPDARGCVRKRVSGSDPGWRWQACQRAKACRNACQRGVIRWQRAGGVSQGATRPSSQPTIHPTNPLRKRVSERDPGWQACSRGAVLGCKTTSVRSRHSLPYGCQIQTELKKPDGTPLDNQTPKMAHHEPQGSVAAGCQKASQVYSATQPSIHPTNDPTDQPAKQKPGVCIPITTNPVATASLQIHGGVGGGLLQKVASKLPRFSVRKYTSPPAVGLVGGLTLISTGGE